MHGITTRNPFIFLQFWLAIVFGLTACANIEFCISPVYKITALWLFSYIASNCVIESTEIAEILREFSKNFFSHNATAMPNSQMHNNTFHISPSCEKICNEHFPVESEFEGNKNMKNMLDISRIISKGMTGQQIRNKLNG